MEKRYQGWKLYDYYQWLLELIDGHKEPFYNYSLLLHELHEMPFIWLIDRDENRAFDGEKLRWIYMDENGIADIFYKEGIPCSVLEMLIGLSIRCNEEILGEPDETGVVRDRSTAVKLFWSMIENLDLMKCSDDNFDRDYVHEQIGKWLKRAFKKDGSGSPFPLNSRACSDQRKVEIWFQMMGYLNEGWF